jgi:hypothetical protein
VEKGGTAMKENFISNMILAHYTNLEVKESSEDRQGNQLCTKTKPKSLSSLVRVILHLSSSPTFGAVQCKCLETREKWWWQRRWCPWYWYCGPSWFRTATSYSIYSFTCLSSRPRFWLIHRETSIAQYPFQPSLFFR